VLRPDDLPRALAARDTRGLIRLVADRASDSLPGLIVANRMEGRI
jgi:mercuric reductase